MRALPLLLLPLVPALAFAQDAWVESPATLALTFSHAGSSTTTPRPGGAVLFEVPLRSFRLGNREILEALVAEGAIDDIRGWRVVGIWAYWPEPADPFVGNAYRLYARRGKGPATETVAIPSDLFSIKPLLPAVGYRKTISANELITGGTENFEVLEEVTFSLQGHTGLLHGIESGSGRYVDQAGTEEALYLPKNSKTTLQGNYSDDGENAAGVVRGSLTFGSAKLVRIPGSSGSVASTDTAGLIKTGTSTFTLGVVDTYQGGTVMTGGTLVVSEPTTTGSTLIVSGSLAYPPGETHRESTTSHEAVLSSPLGSTLTTDTNTSGSSSAMLLADPRISRETAAADLREALLREALAGNVTWLGSGTITTDTITTGNLAPGLDSGADGTLDLNTGSVSLENSATSHSGSLSLTFDAGSFTPGQTYTLLTFDSTGTSDFIDPASIGTVPVIGTTWTFAPETGVLTLTTVEPDPQTHEPSTDNGTTGQQTTEIQTP